MIQGCMERSIEIEIGWRILRADILVYIVWQDLTYMMAADSQEGGMVQQ
jgi:hypothetical protein